MLIWILFVLGLVGVGYLTEKVSMWLWKKYEELKKAHAHLSLNIFH